MGFDSVFSHSALVPFGIMTKGGEHEVENSICQTCDGVEMFLVHWDCNLTKKISDGL